MALDQATTELMAQMAAAGMSPLHTMEPAEARAQAAAMAAQSQALAPGMHRVEEHVVEAGDGGFRVRALVPTAAPEKVVVYYHGGGWVSGDIDGFDTLGRRLAADSGSAVVLVDYRKAPENPYPTAVEDAWQALTWVESALVEGIAGRRVPIVVAGDSAGGNLAAVMAQRSRERSGPRIALQVLIYPVTDADQQTPSYVASANQLMLSAETMAWFWDHYCPPARRTEPEASPLRADDLTGLPPAVVLIAEHDVLRSEGEAYAQRLRDAGVEVSERLFEGQMHGFFTMVDLLPGSADGIAYVAEQVSAQLTARA